MDAFKTLAWILQKVHSSCIYLCKNRFYICYCIFLLQKHLHCLYGLSIIFPSRNHNFKLKAHPAAVTYIPGPGLGCTLGAPLAVCGVGELGALGITASPTDDLDDSPPPLTQRWWCLPRRCWAVSTWGSEAREIKGYHMVVFCSHVEKRAHIYH